MLLISLSMDTPQQASAVSCRTPGPAAESIGVGAQQCAQRAAAPEVEFAIALRTAGVLQPLDERAPLRCGGYSSGRGAGARPGCVLRFDRGHAQPSGGRRHDLAAALRKASSAAGGA